MNCRFYTAAFCLLRAWEANVIDLNGTLDINETERRDVNWLVASIHNLGLPGLENPTVEKCTQLWLNIAHDPKVNVIGHSGSPEFRYDYETVIPGVRSKPQACGD